MKLTIESTTKIVTMDGIQVRVWEGQTESGIPVHCYITRVAVAKDCVRLQEFERELKKCRTPSAKVAAIPIRLTL